MTISYREESIRNKDKEVMSLLQEQNPIVMFKEIHQIPFHLNMNHNPLIVSCKMVPLIKELSTSLVLLLGTITLIKVLSREMKRFMIRN